MPVLTGLFDGEIAGANAGVVLIFIGLAIFAVQFFCCWKWEHILIRLLPAISVFAVMVYFFIMVTTIESLEALGYVILLFYSALMLIPVILGWIAWGIFCLAHNHESVNPDGY